MYRLVNEKNIGRDFSLPFLFECFLWLSDHLRVFDACGVFHPFGGGVLNGAQEIDLKTYTNKNYLCISSPYTKDEEKKIKDIVHLQ